MTAELDDLRGRIDELDREIVRLLTERARLGIAAGRAKAAVGRGVPDPDREREVLLRVAMANPGPLPQAAVVELYRSLIETIKGLEESDTGRPQGGE